MTDIAQSMLKLDHEINRMNKHSEHCAPLADKLKVAKEQYKKAKATYKELVEQVSTNVTEHLLHQAAISANRIEVAKKVDAAIAAVYPNGAPPLLKTLVDARDNAVKYEQFKDVIEHIMLCLGSAKGVQVSAGSAAAADTSSPMAMPAAMPTATPTAVNDSLEESQKKLEAFNEFTKSMGLGIHARIVSAADVLDLLEQANKLARDAAKPAKESMKESSDTQKPADSQKPADTPTVSSLITDVQKSNNTDSMRYCTDCNRHHR